MSRRVKRVLVVCAMLFTLDACAEQVIAVPKGRQVVMVDGKLGPGEWGEAASFALGDKGRVYVKQSDAYVWIAVEYLAADDFILDLYLQPSDGMLYDLHSSAKLGERRFAGHWSDDWTWWNNDRWVANWSHVDSFEKRTLLPQKIREYQISRARFAGKSWRVMFDLQSPGKDKWRKYVYPQEARNTSAESWLTLRF